MQHHAAVRISTRTPHAGSDEGKLTSSGKVKVFQPALPMRGVTRQVGGERLRRLISTRTPHAGSDTKSVATANDEWEFQPALPMRGVTASAASRLEAGAFQPALPMRGVTYGYGKGLEKTDEISTRTPHAGSDAPWFPPSTRTWTFQPALPMRGVTAILCANLLLRSTYSVIRQTRYTQQARQASLCHTIWCEPHVCHMRASCSHHGPTMPRTLQLRTLASHLHAQSSSHICFQDCRIANYLSPDRSARRARS